MNTGPVHNKGERSKALVAPETLDRIDEGILEVRRHQGNLSPQKDPNEHTPDLSGLDDYWRVGS